jgi:hypothetical protein
MNEELKRKTLKGFSFFFGKMGKKIKKAAEILIQRY